MPLTSSVTPCSTWSRALTSRNQNVAVAVEQELGRRRVAVARRPPPTRTASRGARAAASGVRPGAGASSMSFWWRRWIEQSRSPSATTAPGRVAEELDLDVARRPDLALEVDRAVAEGRGRLARAGDQGRRQLLRRVDPAHAPAAAARRGLDQQRVADPPRPAATIAATWSGRVDRRRLEGARHDRHADRARRRRAAQLVAERRDRAARGPTKTSPAASTPAAKAGPLGEEAVAGMDRLGAGRERGRDDRGRPRR